MAITIGNRSREGVVKRLRGLRPFLERDLLLPGANEFRLDTITKLATPPTVNRKPKQLADYIAISSILHMWDAWSYLSRASASLASGDSDSAVHLAYYSELRAGMSILASHGVGVFDRGRHYFVNSAGRVNHAGTGSTHEFAWNALCDWVSTSGWSDLALRVRPGGVSISQWLSTFPSYAAAQAIGQHMLGAFGLDLKRLGSDRALRNESSYRPTAFRYVQPRDLGSELSGVHDVAKMMVAVGEFGDCPLSRAVLSRVLEYSFRQSKGTPNATDMAAFRRELEIAHAGIGQPGGAVMIDQLIQFAQDPPTILENALGDLDSTKSGHHTQVVARASVLCFLASCFVRPLLHEAGLTSADLEFWLLPHARSRGVIADQLPDPISDLWADLDEALNSVSGISAANPVQSTVHEDDSGSIPSLCRFERIAVLGLAT